MEEKKPKPPMKHKDKHQVKKPTPKKEPVDPDRVKSGKTGTDDEAA